jgi:hypothetical protein
MRTILGGHCVCQITHHTNTDIFTALSLLQTLDYIHTHTHTHTYTKSQEQTLKKHAHLSGFHFLIKKDIIYKVERLPLLLSPFNILWWSTEVTFGTMFLKWQPDNSEQMHVVSKRSVLKATGEWHPSALVIHCFGFYARPLMELFSWEIISLRSI